MIRIFFFFWKKKRLVCHEKVTNVRRRYWKCWVNKVDYPAHYPYFPQKPALRENSARGDSFRGKSDTYG